MAGNAVVLDRVLAHYGAETRDIRDALHSAIADMVGSTGAKNHLEQLGQAATVSREVIFDKITDLVPHTDAQRTLQAQAESMAINLGQTRWLLFAQSGTSISTPFLVIVVFWLTLPELWVVCAAQRDRVYHPIDKCPVGCGCHVSHP
jgi:hypothetical protein